MTVVPTVLSIISAASVDAYVVAFKYGSGPVGLGVILGIL
jgi:hypothetical protein